MYGRAVKILLHYFLFLLPCVVPLTGSDRKVPATEAERHPAFTSHTEPYEERKVADINVVVESRNKGYVADKERILSSLGTKKGDPFSQTTFDQDLKALSKEYAFVEPDVKRMGDEISVTLTLRVKPTIHAILFHGNSEVRTGTLKRELGIRPGTPFNQDLFVLGLNKIREYYVKRGYFESDISYEVISLPDADRVTLEVLVHEGRSGRIGAIRFSGLTKEEEGAVARLMQTKKYGLFSIISGTGSYHEEALEQDQLVIVNYLHNLGYADAYVTIRTEEGAKGRLVILVDAVKGTLFRFGRITVEGNTLFDKEKILTLFTVKEGDLFSPERLREGIRHISDLYGRKGYIETSAHYTLRPASEENVYDVDLRVTEDKRFRVGLVRTVGNIVTRKNVILRESHLIPGEVFDTHRLQATQERLSAIGYFKSVNVYAVKAEEQREGEENYRDVIIEVEERPTGSTGMTGGLTSTDRAFIGLEFAERNFNHRGLIRVWREGLGACRGAGEYVRLIAKLGLKQQDYALTWIDPYLNDTLWRFGFDVGYSTGRLQAKDDYKTNKTNGALFFSYPLSTFWTFGVKTRLSNSIIHIYRGGPRTQEARDNSGLVSGWSASITFDSTDHPFKPHRGMRSYTAFEIAGVRRHANHPRLFPFAKAEFFNTYYYPLWRKGTIKLRTEFRFLYPFGTGRPDLISLGERFFLGGESSVRGYRPFIIGKKFTIVGKDGRQEKDSDAPMGGVSSSLASIEYLQNIFKMLDCFLFFDAGAISQRRVSIPRPEISTGIGLRVDIAGRLPVAVGVGFPIKPTDRDDVRHVFFSLGTTF